MSQIEIKAAKKVFKSKKQVVTALNSVTLTINSGDIYGIVGYSGAGKSTLLRLLNGLEQPSEGQVLVDQQDIGKLKGYDLRKYRQKVGMIFQHFNLLWSRTILENVRLPLELSGRNKVEANQKASELLALVGLSGKEDAYPSQLSGGQKQRVGIARALANDPTLLLCDESTSALDPQTTDEVLELLEKINRELGVTIVLITHEMAVIRKICHQVAVMENGQVVEQGDVLKVFSQPQEAITKRFVQQEVVPNYGNPLVKLEDLAKEKREGLLVQVTFKGNQASQPLISKMIKTSQVDVNVIQGQIQALQKGSVGTLLIELLGQKASIEKALNYLEKQEEVSLEVANYEEI